MKHVQTKRAVLSLGTGKYFGAVIKIMDEMYVICDKKCIGKWRELQKFS